MKEDGESEKGSFFWRTWDWVLQLLLISSATDINDTDESNGKQIYGDCIIYADWLPLVLLHNNTLACALFSIVNECFRQFSCECDSRVYTKLFLHVILQFIRRLAFTKAQCNNDTMYASVRMWSSVSWRSDVIVSDWICWLSLINLISDVKHLDNLIINLSEFTCVYLRRLAVFFYFKFKPSSRDESNCALIWCNFNRREETFWRMLWLLNKNL